MEITHKLLTRSGIMTEYCWDESTQLVYSSTPVLHPVGLFSREQIEGERNNYVLQVVKVNLENE